MEGGRRRLARIRLPTLWVDGLSATDIGPETSGVTADVNKRPSSASLHINVSVEQDDGENAILQDATGRRMLPNEGHRDADDKQQQQ